MNKEFLEALEEIERERGVSKQVIIESINTALVSSYKKNYNSTSNVDIEVEFDENSDKVRVFNNKTVVDEVIDEDSEISLEAAKSYIPNADYGDIVHIEITPKDFGRIAAQTAKQVVIQKIKDAERDIVYGEYIDRENDIITGQINRIRKGTCYIDLGRIEGVLSENEQSPNETYHIGDRMKMLITEVKKTGKGAQVLLSRSHPNLVRKLFELEVPEIAEGSVEIFHVSREAGSRTKIAIFARDPEVDALGACVGFQGNRVKSIVDELRGEKIDIIIWSNDAKEFIKNSIAPATATEVIVDEHEKTSVVFVPEGQLSLAIGKEGQNARLAARLTNYKIDIKSDDELESYLEEQSTKKKNDFSFADVEDYDDEYDTDDGDYYTLDEDEETEAEKDDFYAGQAVDEFYNDYSMIDANEDLEFGEEGEHDFYEDR